MLDGQLGLVTIAKPLLNRSLAEVKPIHYARYQAGPETREFERNETDHILPEAAIKPAHAELAAPVCDEEGRFSTLFRRLPET